MVTITIAEELVNRDNKPFRVLTLEDLDFQINTNTDSGKQHADTPKVRIPTDMSMEACQMLLKTTLPGKLVKATVPKYTFTNKEGKSVTTTVRWQYVQ